MPNVSLHLGDCLSVMRDMPADSIDAIVCDPPYMINFMNKKFDRAKDNPAANVEVWAEMLRVAKPGAMLLAFGGDRTHHRMMCAIEDAGWELRTCLYWCFGSGFPKSHDVSKAIDRMRNDALYHVTAYVALHRDRMGFTNGDIDRHFNFHGMAGHWTSQKSQPAVPTWEQWQQLKSLLALGDEMDAEVWRLNGRKGKPGEAWYEREVVGQRAGAQSESTGKYGGWGNDDGTGKSLFDITAPATDAAKQWLGWGSALKPAVEIIVCARKPLSEPTIAANVLVHGVGGLNIDACRIGTEQTITQAKKGMYGAGSAEKMREQGFRPYRIDNRDFPETANPPGRWPANLLLSDDAAALLDEMSGERKGATSNSDSGADARNTFSKGWTGRDKTPGYADTGGASRYFLRVAPDDEPLRIFYCAKASKRDRDEGLEGMPEHPAAAMQGNLVDGQRLAGNGTPVRTPMRANGHPCVKPLALMRWLTRLVCRPGGTVLDPFCGSGSTGKACMLEGFDFVGIDNEPEYLELARARIDHARQQVAQMSLELP